MFLQDAFCQIYIFVLNLFLWFRFVYSSLSLFVWIWSWWLRSGNLLKSCSVSITLLWTHLSFAFHSVFINFWFWLFKFYSLTLGQTLCCSCLLNSCILWWLRSFNEVCFILRRLRRSWILLEGLIKLLFQYIALSGSLCSFSSHWRSEWIHSWIKIWTCSFLLSHCIVNSRSCFFV